MDRPRRRRAFVVLTACLLVLGALLPMAARAAEALGSDVVVSETGNDPQVAMRTRERVVVVWGDTTGVMARYFRVGEAGPEALGPAFRVDQGVVPNQPKPRVSMDRDGNFVVVWDAGLEVRAQLFDAAGVRRGSILSIGDPGRANQPRVSMAPDGRFVVAWEDLVSGQLRYAMFDADGGRLGTVRGVPARVGGGTAALLVDVGAGTDSFAVAWNEARGSAANGMVALFNWNGRLLRRAYRFEGTVLKALSWSNAGPVALVADNSQFRQIFMQRFSPVSGQRVGPLRRLPDAYLASLVGVDSDPRGRLVGLFQIGFPISGGTRVEYEPLVQLYGPEGKSLSDRYFASGSSSMEPLAASSLAFTRDGTVVVAWRYVYNSLEPAQILLNALQLP